MARFKRAAVRWLAPVALAAWVAAGSAAAQTFPVKMARHQSSYFKGVNPIVVPSYHVTFFNAHEASAGSTLGARARLTKALSGVDEAGFRRLVDEAHADLKAQFAAAGYTVASDEQARAVVTAAAIPLLPNNGEYVPVESAPTIGKGLKKGWLMVGPSAAPALAPYKYGSNYMGQIGINNRFAKGQPVGTLVVLPNLVLDFAEIGGTSQTYRGTQSANVGGSTVFTLRGRGSPVTVVKVMDRGRMFPATITPEQDYTVPTAFATEQPGGAGVKPFFFNGVSTSVTRGDAVVVNQPVWEGLVRQAFKDYNAAIVASVVKGRG